MIAGQDKCNNGGRTTAPLTARLGRWLTLSLLAIVIVVAASALAAQARPATDLSPTAAQGALIDWAVVLFEEAGLDVPSFDVARHGSPDPCFGRTGAHVYGAGRSTVHICTDAAGRREEILFLHEVAHVWERARVTDAQRHAFLALRGLTEWRNTDPRRWLERGSEQAAEILVWGLLDRPMWPARLPPSSCADLRAAFEVLTGRPPRHGYPDYCS